MDPDPIARAGLSAFVDADPKMTLLGSVAELDSFRKTVADLKPDVAVTEVNLPEMACVKTIEWIRDRHPSTRAVVLTDHDRAIFARWAMRAGAAAAISKDKDAAELLAVIRAVHVAQTDTEHRVDARDNATPVSTGERNRSELDRLTPREFEVLRHLALGRSVKQTALLLEIGAKTVDNHKTRLMKKLDIHDRVGLLRFAIHQGLGEP